MQRAPHALLLCAALFAGFSSAKLPHILLILADDLGYGNVGWTRKETGSETPEVQTPEMDALVAEGIELSRFYVYHMCSPTRSALQTGRLPMHVNMINADPTIYNASESTGTGAGIPRNMTGIATKLSSVGYRTHMAGKWDAGMATPTHTPYGRGYDSALCYFHHGNSYWKEQTGDLNCPVGVDLYDTLGPAHGLNGTQKDLYNVSAFEDYIFEQRLLSVIKAHNPAEPLFLFYAAHLVHDPYEVPQQYLDKFSKAGGGPFDNTTTQDTMRMTYHAMTNFLDGVVGNLTAAFQERGLWENTLLWFFSDNGGPIYAGGNNHPLRGGKYSEFEGGVRVAAFVSGGFIAPSLRGTRNSGLGCVADVYATLCALAGVDARDTFATAAGLPPVDGMDLSPMFTGAQSPRKEVPLMPMKLSDVASLDEYDSAIQNGTGKKTPQCWKVGECDFLGANLSVHHDVSLNDCCTLCNTSKHHCAAASWTKVTPHSGTCSLKVSADGQVNSKTSACWLPTASNAMPVPIVHGQSGIVIGDMKLILGDNINMAIWTGPHYPNMTTPVHGNWTTNSGDVPGFPCSTPQKRGCLFNVTADPSEHRDLAHERPDDFLRLLSRLREVSKSQFNPRRGDGDPAACEQQARNGNFFGPWLP